jgi:hypothetical protein
MHSVKYNYCPKSFNEIFVRYNADDIHYELRHQQEFQVPRARIELFKKIPIYLLCVEWNNCDPLCFYNNPTTFKIELYNTLFNDYAIHNGLASDQ